MALPAELDFTANPAATPARMDRAMEYIVARFRAVEAVQPDFLAAIETLKAVGLDRLAEALIPVFDQANGIAATLEALKTEWEADLTREQVRDDVTERVVEEFADYRHRYLGAKSEAPTEREDGSAVAVGDMYFDLGLDAMRVLGASGWKNAGSSVAGIMEQFALTATAGQTSFAIPEGYEPGYLIVYVNGIALETGDYTATNGTTVVFAEGLSAGDSVSGVKFGSVNLATVYNKTQSDSRYAPAGQSYTKTESDARYSNGITQSAADNRYAKNDLSNLPNASAARQNLGLGSAAARNDAFFLKTGAGVTGTVSAGTAAPSGGSDGDVYFRYT